MVYCWNYMSMGGLTSLTCFSLESREYSFICLIMYVGLYNFQGQLNRYSELLRAGRSGIESR